MIADRLTCGVIPGARGAGVPQCPAWIARAGESRAIGPVESIAAGRYGADPLHLVGMLRASWFGGSVQGSLEARSGAGRVALAAVEVRGFIVAALHRQDGGDAPATQDQVGDARTGSAKSAAMAIGEVVQHGRVPAMTAGSTHVAKIDVGR